MNEENFSNHQSKFWLKIQKGESMNSKGCNQNSMDESRGNSRGSDALLLL